jgi:hypothetical protein
MDRCENCLHGINVSIPDRQIRQGKRCLYNWKCNHSDAAIKKYANKLKGFSENCPEFKPKHYPY